MAYIKCVYVGLCKWRVSYYSLNSDFQKKKKNPISLSLWFLPSSIEEIFESSALLSIICYCFQYSFYENIIRNTCQFIIQNHKKLSLLNYLILFFVCWSLMKDFKENIPIIVKIYFCH